MSFSFSHVAYFISRDKRRQCQSAASVFVDGLLSLADGKAFFFPDSFGALIALCV